MARVTAFCTDSFLLEHAAPGHPERPERLAAAMGLLTDTGMLARLMQVAATPAPREALTRVHTADYVDALQRFAADGGGWLDMDTYVGVASYDVACLAAGGLLQVLDAVLTGQAANGFALIRPPGHHATPTHGMGFCLFNNVALAARAALDAYGLRRALIVDWDVHHGNGTQDAFYADDRVLFFSVHEYRMGFYPGTGRADETGAGRGTGYTVNVPLPPGVGDVGYRRVFDEALAPLARRFAPDLVLVSAGYDAHWRDPLAHMGLSVAGYAALARQVVALADELCAGRIVCALEGGYDAQALAYGVMATLAALLGDNADPVDPIGPSHAPETDAEPVIARVCQIHGV